VAVSFELTDLNSNTVLPGFHLRLVGGEWRIFYLLTAFQAEDHTLSVVAAESCLTACRNSLVRYLPQLEAVIASARSPPLGERPAGLDAASTAQVHKLAGVGKAAAIAEVAQPFFTKTRILVAREGHRTVYLAAPKAGAWRALTDAGVLAEIAAAEAPAGIGERAGAEAYARAADRWLAAPDVPYRVVEAASEVPAATGVELDRPRFFRTAAGFVLSLWALAGDKLVYRELLVPPDGRVLRTERPVR
jgi:hypothetical protein